MRRVLLFMIAVFTAPALSGVAGSAGSLHALWVIRDLGLSGTPVAMNDRGQVVVQAATSGKAFLWEKGRATGLGGKGTTAWSVNERGQVVGTSEGRAFLWQNGKMRNLGGGSGYAYRINERAQVIGKGTASGYGRAFLWQSGRTTDLGSLGGSQSEAVAINANGQIVGWSATRRHDRLGRPIKHAFMWQAGRMIDLNPPGPFRSRAVAINVSGEVLIQTFRESSCLDYSTCPGNEDPTPTNERAWLWAGGKFTRLGTLGGSSATAVGLNAEGQAIGISKTSRGNDHGFLWQNGTITDLGTLPQRPGAAYWPKDINDRGQVVGSVFGENSENWRSWVWANGQMTDLGTLGGGYAQTGDINERGQIVGWSATKTGKRHVVLWTLRSG